MAQAVLYFFELLSVHMKVYKRKCDYLGCYSKTLVVNQAQLGLCDHHKGYLDKEEVIVILCWHCGTVLAFKKKNEMTEKYIFRDGCGRCSEGLGKGGKWLTISKAPTMLEVDPTGKLKNGETPFHLRYPAELLDGADSMPFKIIGGGIGSDPKT